MPTKHEELFGRYVEELREAKAAAEEWWNKLIDAEMRRAGSRENAIHNIRRRWGVGPAAHPYVIAVLRKFYLACERLNQELAESAAQDEEVYPQIFTTEWLLDGTNDDLADFLNSLTYWPIGLDQHGRHL